MTRQVLRGRTWPLGVTPLADGSGVNVAVWAPDATALLLCVFTGDEEDRIEIPYSEGGIWCGRVEGLGPGTRYGFRAVGPYAPESGLRFNPNKLLIDPYAHAIEAPLRWHPDMSDGGEADERDSAHAVPKCLVMGEAEGPDPRSNRPQHSLTDLVIYETHVKGLTAGHPGVPEPLRGSYAGMAHPVIIEHLVSLGVSAVELLPIQAFFDDQLLVERGATNYWGYQPLAWCAPEPRYAQTWNDADTELRQLVHTLHEAGIEVIIDVVYNHTGEGDESGPIVAHRGLNDRGYYRRGSAYINDTGTGNTFAAEQAMPLRLILDSLRHWADRYGVDGFRFDLATVLGRTATGFTLQAAFFQAVQQDPVLQQLKLIAEPWDLGVGGYRLGSFPYPWLEWNDRFRDGTRRAWKGEGIGPSGIASLLLGSAEHFEHSGRPATSSVNFITSHDGFTLEDLVSYAHKHNEANGEDNRDGHDNNHSDSFGVEGPTDDAGLLVARGRRKRAMLATLLVAQGVPMLLAGDEIGNTQHGNNNAYAQDNEIGWVDWSRPDQQLLAVVRRLIELRRAHAAFRQRTFLHALERADGEPDFIWRRADGEEATESDWHDSEWRCLVAKLQGTKSAHTLQGGRGRYGARGSSSAANADTVLVILNTGDDIEVQLPNEQTGGWCIEIDTARPQAAGEAPRTYRALAQSVVVLAPAESEGIS